MRRRPSIISSLLGVVSLINFCFWQVLVASFVANESAVINAPFLKLAEELDDLKSIANSFIERQETPGQTLDECIPDKLM